MPVRGQLRLVQPAGTNNLRAALQSVQNEVGVRTRGARRYIGHESVMMLRSPQRSKVNVDTGTMRRNFYFKVSGGNNRIDIFNRAHSENGYFYPLKIEREYRGAARTIVGERNRIIRDTRLRLAALPDGPRGTLRYEVP